MSRLRLTLENGWRGLQDADRRISLATQAALLFFLMTLTLASASVQQYLADNLDQMLGSDLVVESHSPVAPEKEAALKSLAQRSSVTQLGEITLTHGERWARVLLKRVDDAYPLQGSLQVGAGLADLPRRVVGGPSPGEIWLDPRLALRLGVQVGDRLRVGGDDLRITGILHHEPDRILEGHSTALRAMAHASSLQGAAIGDSRVRTRYLIAADESQQTALEVWASKALPDANLIKRVGGQHPLASFWQRTESFLGLASVILFFMGAVALDMTNRRWLAKTRFRLAIYASFGVSHRTGMLMALGEWLIGFVLATVVAGVLAFLAHGGIVAQLRGTFPGLQPTHPWGPGLSTVGLVFVLLVALQIPSFLQLRRDALLSLLRHPAQTRDVSQRLFWSAASVALLAGVYSDNWQLTGLTMAACASALALMAALTWTVIRLGDLWGRRRAGLLPFVLFMMRQRLFSKSAQVLGLGLCGLLLLFTLTLARDLSATMESHRRSHDGNLLIAEAQGEQVQAIERWAAQTGSAVRSLRPFVFAQLVAVNGKPLDVHVQKPSDTMAQLKEPIRLSWTDEMPFNNRLVGGTWWVPGTAHWQQISTEPDVMSDLGLRYGDRLRYQMGSQFLEFTLVASHAPRPGGGSITFWFQVPQSARAHMDTTTRYMGSMELPVSAWDALAGLWQQHPTLSLVPLRELTERFDRTVGIAAQVTLGYATMVFLLSLFVLAASVSGFSADDRRKNGLLMSMGLKHSDCLRLNLQEWGLTALMAATGAIVGTWIAGRLIYRAQFNLSYHPDPLWTAAMVAAMVASVCLVGYAACRRSLKVSVLDLLAR